MDVRIDIDKKFDKDLKKLSAKDNDTIAKKLNHLIELIRTGQNTSSRLFKLHKIHFQENLDSSLYVFKVNTDLRILLTSEEDPLFDEHILTLLRVVHHKDLEKIYSGLAQSLYQSFINKRNDLNG